MNLIRFITRNLSLRISLIVVYGLSLLTITLVAIFHFAHNALKEEAVSNAQQTLDGTVQQIDNILLNVEQSAGNIYFELIRHKDQPEMMYTYCRELIASNRYIVGCAIAFKPDYFPGRHLFMAYVRRQGYSLDNDVSSVLVTQETFTNKPYTEQRWYTEPMKSGRPGWIDPLKNEEAEGEALVTFCLPILDKDRNSIGVLAADIPLELLSDIILAVKPSKHGYATMLGRNGSYIVHPDKEKLTRLTVFEQANQDGNRSIQEAAEAMVSGKEGENTFMMDGQEWHVFYQPFKRTVVPGRTMEKLSWSVGVIYPLDDIYGEYNQLFRYLLAAAIVALVILFALCWLIIRRQLKPLEMLTQSAQRIANGHYNEPLPDTRRDDEIGLLQKNFNKVQQSLTDYISQQKKLNKTLMERGEVLKTAYSNVQKSDHIKTSFLHFMTNQMIEPSKALYESVTTLCDHYDTMSMEEINHETEIITQQSTTIVELTDQLLIAAEGATGKEGSYE